MDDRRYFKVVSAIDIMQELLKRLDGSFFFAITFPRQSLAWYFVLTSKIQEDIIKKFGEMDGVTMQEITEKEIKGLDTSQRHSFKGTIHLSPWPGRGLSI